MTKQQNLHRAGLSAVADLEKLIDRLKEAGPCPLEGRNALMNLRQQIEGLLNRLPQDTPKADSGTLKEGWSVVRMGDTILPGHSRLARFEIRGPNRLIPGTPAYPPLLATIEQDWGMDREETTQVAHTMGAAQDMLAALKEAHRTFGPFFDTSEEAQNRATAMMEAAIAKAEGH